MAESKWSVSGEYVESCNCDYLCPCIYTNPQAGATGEQCTSLQVYRVDRGSFGEVKLDGLAFAMIIRSGKVMSDGNWIFAGIVDAAGNEAQRQALTRIVSGESGGPPGRIRDLLTGDFRGVEVKPIAFAREGLKRSTEIPGVLAFAIEGVASRTNNGEPIYLDNVAHSAGRRLALARSQETHIHAFGLDLDMVGKGNNGHFAPFNWAA
ncbi:MAG: DUF1326 domain-containing protein [Gammaproteobacteria bacterium]|nr:DUF1326 domain-containing protein [Gammaproteobacteria bacterium]